MIQFGRISLLAGFAALVLLLGGAGVAEPGSSENLPRIVLEVPDTLVSPNESDGWLSIYLSNYVDSIEGVQFQLLLDRPDLVTWDLSGAGFDTTGTLVSGFELVTVRDTSGTGALIRFTCLADYPFYDTIVTPGFGPQQGGVVVRLPFVTAGIDDTVAQRTCNISIIDPVGFSDPTGTQIGIITDTVIDTAYLACTLYVEDTCAGYAEVDPDTEPYDSVHIYEDLVGYLDSSQVVLSEGSITLAVPDAVNCDLTGDRSVNVSDLSCLVDFLFRGQAGGCGGIVYCGCNNGGSEPEQPNVSDLSCLVDFLFRGGPSPGS